MSVDESILAVVVSKGACTRGELYLVNTATLQKSGPYELGYNPDAVDIAVDNEYVVVVNEFDYEDGVDGGCDNLGFQEFQFMILKVVLTKEHLSRI